MDWPRKVGRWALSVNLRVAGHWMLKLIMGHPAVRDALGMVTMPSESLCRLLVIRYSKHWAVRTPMARCLAAINLVLSWLLRTIHQFLLSTRRILRPATTPNRLVSCVTREGG